MGSLTKQIVEKNLKKKGFVQYNGGNHLNFSYEENGCKLGIHTVMSHSTKELRDTLISSMAKQLHLSKSEFVDFARCSISQEEYKKILKTKGII